MLDEVGLGAYRPTKVPFISENNKIEFCSKKPVDKTLAKNYLYR
jgi:hypothetical protein